jgi:hypothetical protein
MRACCDGDVSEVGLGCRNRSSVIHFDPRPNLQPEAEISIGNGMSGMRRDRETGSVARLALHDFLRITTFRRPGTIDHTVEPVRVLRGR